MPRYAQFSVLLKAPSVGLRLGMLALSVSALLSGASQPAWAQDTSGRQVKDFKHRKRLIVPASENLRRIDYQALPGTRLPDVAQLCS
jgi:hypothetical protein